MLTRIWDDERRRWRVVESLSFTGPHAEISLLHCEPGDERFRAEHRCEQLGLATVVHTAGSPAGRRRRGARRARREW